MKFFSKLKSVINATPTIDPELKETYIEDIINDIENAPFAAAEENVLYAGQSELAGYHYLQSVIVGTLQLKTVKGAELLITGTDFELRLKSDSVELESEPSSVANRNMTKIDFEIDKEDVSKIEKAHIESIILVAKNTEIPFKIIEVEKVITPSEEEE